MLRQSFCLRDSYELLCWGLIKCWLLPPVLQDRVCEWIQVLCSGWGGWWETVTNILHRSNKDLREEPLIPLKYNARQYPLSQGCVFISRQRRVTWDRVSFSVREWQQCWNADFPREFMESVWIALRQNSERWVKEKSVGKRGEHVIYLIGGNVWTLTWIMSFPVSLNVCARFKFTLQM